MAWRCAHPDNLGREDQRLDKTGFFTFHMPPFRAGVLASPLGTQTHNSAAFNSPVMHDSDTPAAPGIPGPDRCAGIGDSTDAPCNWHVFCLLQRHQSRRTAVSDTMHPPQSRAGAGQLRVLRIAPYRLQDRLACGRPEMFAVGPSADRPYRDWPRSEPTPSLAGYRAIEIPHSIARRQPA